MGRVYACVIEPAEQIFSPLSPPGSYSGPGIWQDEGGNRGMHHNSMPAQVGQWMLVLSLGAPVHRASRRVTGRTTSRGRNRDAPWVS